MCVDQDECNERLSFGELGRGHEDLGSSKYNRVLAVPSRDMCYHDVCGAIVLVVLESSPAAVLFEHILYTSMTRPSIYGHNRRCRFLSRILHAFHNRRHIILIQLQLPSQFLPWTFFLPVPIGSCSSSTLILALLLTHPHPK